ADADARPGMITNQLIADLVHAELVIADFAFLNPNVFYENGIRHREQKKIIHLLLKGHDMPFDLSHYRTVIYSRKTVEDIEQARADLIGQLAAIMKPEYKVDNPVTQALGYLEVQETATDREKVILSQLDDVVGRVQYLEQRLALNDQLSSPGFRGILPEALPPSLLTAVVRGNLPEAPIHNLSANTGGTCKIERGSRS